MQGAVAHLPCVVVPCLSTAYEGRWCVRVADYHSTKCDDGLRTDQGSVDHGIK